MSSRSGWGSPPPLAPAPSPKDLVVARSVTKLGRFKRIDPTEGRAPWTRWRWGGLLLWFSLVGGSLWKAWRQHGGLPEPPNETSDPA
ncbi:MAG: hypothetical protein KY469_11945 [Actinobacteria bacterium]|nr:hypothetical protein [Actinomycetota bacterium]